MSVTTIEDTAIIRSSNPGVFCKKKFSYKFCKIHKRTPALKCPF